jgi:hypothetical protein
MPASQVGQELTMTSCTRCEHRAWTSTAGTVLMPDVLRNLSGRQDFVLSPALRPTRRAGRQRADTK